MTNGIKQHTTTHRKQVGLVIGFMQQGANRHRKRYQAEPLQIVPYFNSLSVKALPM
jgi:hypothetical protein